MIDGGHGSGPSLYHYQPRTGAFLDARWDEICARCPAARAAAETLGAGAAPWLRVNGDCAGEQAEPALRAMLERLYEDATSFALPRGALRARLRSRSRRTLYRDAGPRAVVAPLRGVVLESERVDLGDGLALVRRRARRRPGRGGLAGGRRRRAVRAVRARARRARRRADPGRRGRGALPRPGHARCDCGRPGGSRSARPAGALRRGPLAAAGVRRSRYRARARRGRLHTARSRTCASSSRRSATRRPAAAVGWALGRFEMGCERPPRRRGAVRLPARRCARCSTRPATPARPAWRCAWRRSAPRRARRRRCSAGWRPRSSLERFVMGRAEPRS